jgi:hypothetical protein
MNPSDLISILTVLNRSNFTIDNKIEVITGYYISVSVVSGTGSQYTLEIDCQRWLQGVDNFPVKVIDCDPFTGNHKTVATYRLGSLDKFEG